MLLEEFLKEKKSFYEMFSLIGETKKEVSGYVAIDSIDKLLSGFILERWKKEFKETIYNYLNVSGFLPLVNYKKTEDIINKENSINIDLFEYENLFVNAQLQIILKHAYQDSLSKINRYLSEHISKLLQVLNNTRTKCEC